MSVPWSRRALLNRWLSLLDKREGKKDATACLCWERSFFVLLAGRTLQMRRQAAELHQPHNSSDICFLQTVTEFKHLAAIPCIKMLYLLLNWTPNSLTLLQTDSLLGWCECCLCQPGTWSDHRMNASSAERWALVSLGWYPEGPGSPGRVHWHGTVAAGSSLGPCNPPGHLQKGKEDFRAMVTLSVIDIRMQELFPMHTTEKFELTPA